MQASRSPVSLGPTGNAEGLFHDGGFRVAELMHLPFIEVDARVSYKYAPEMEPPVDSAHAHEYAEAAGEYAFPSAQINPHTLKASMVHRWEAVDRRSAGERRPDNHRHANENEFVAEFGKIDVTRVEHVLSAKLFRAQSPMKNSIVTMLQDGRVTIDDILKSMGAKAPRSTGSGQITFPTGDAPDWDDTGRARLDEMRRTYSERLTAESHTSRLARGALVVCHSVLQHRAQLKRRIDERRWDIQQISTTQALSVGTNDIIRKSFIYAKSSLDPTYHAMLVLMVVGLRAVDYRHFTVYDAVDMPAENTIDNVVLVATGGLPRLRVIENTDIQELLRDSKLALMHYYKYASDLGIVVEATQMLNYMSMVVFAIPPGAPLSLPFAQVERPLLDLLMVLAASSDTDMNHLVTNVEELVYGAPLVAVKWKVATAIMQNNFAPSRYANMVQFLIANAHTWSQAAFKTRQAFAALSAVLGRRTGGLELFGFHGDLQAGMTDCQINYESYGYLMCQFKFLPNAVMRGLLSDGVDMSGQYTQGSTGQHNPLLTLCINLYNNDILTTWNSNVHNRDDVTMLEIQSWRFALNYLGDSHRSGSKSFVLPTLPTRKRPMKETKLARASDFDRVKQWDRRDPVPGVEPSVTTGTYEQMLRDEIEVKRAEIEEEQDKAKQLLHEAAKRALVIEEIRAKEEAQRFAQNLVLEEKRAKEQAQREEYENIAIAEHKLREQQQASQASADVVKKRKKGKSKQSLAKPAEVAPLKPVQVVLPPQAAQGLAEQVAVEYSTKKHADQLIEDESWALDHPLSVRVEVNGEVVNIDTDNEAGVFCEGPADRSDVGNWGIADVIYDVASVAPLELTRKGQEDWQLRIKMLRATLPTTSDSEAAQSFKKSIHSRILLSSLMAAPESQTPAAITALVETYGGEEHRSKVERRLRTSNLDPAARHEEAARQWRDKIEPVIISGKLV